MLPKGSEHQEVTIVNGAEGRLGEKVRRDWSEGGMRETPGGRQTWGRSELWPYQSTCQG